MASARLPKCVVHLVRRDTRHGVRHRCVRVRLVCPFDPPGCAFDGGGDERDDALASVAIPVGVFLCSISDNFDERRGSLVVLQAGDGGIS